MTVRLSGKSHKTNQSYFREPAWTRDDPHVTWIDSQVPPDHIARLIARVVDELDHSALLDSYAGVGLQAYPPWLLLKLVIYETYQGRPRPTQWLKDLKENIPVQWLVRGIRPSLSRLYAFRDRLEPFLDEWTRVVLEIAQREGWLVGETVSLDGTFLEANASRHKLLNEKRLNERIDALEAAVAIDEQAARSNASEVIGSLAGEVKTASDPSASRQGPESPVAVLIKEGPADDSRTEPTLCDSMPPATEIVVAADPAETTAPADIEPEEAATPKWMGRTPKGLKRQLERFHAAGRQMARLHQLNTRRRKDKRRSPEQIRVSTTDVDSRLGKDKRGTYRPLYNVQVMRDVNSRFIVAADAFAQPTDAGTLEPMLDLGTSQLGHQPERVLTDSAYTTPADLEFAAKRNVILVGPYLENDFTAKPTGSKGDKQIPKESFTWDSTQQCFVCPEGHPLMFEGRTSKQRASGESVPFEIYRCDPVHCVGCPKQHACTKVPERGRTVRRHPQQDLIDEHRKRMEEPQYKALYRLRGSTIELVFADAKTHRNLGRLSGRGLRRAKIETRLMALTQNLVLLENYRNAAHEESAGAKTRAFAA